MLMAILVQTMVPPLGVVWKYANWPEVFIVIVRMKETVLSWCYIIIYIYTYTNGAIFPMLAQVVYIAYTPLCRWYMNYIHHFAK